MAVEVNLSVTVINLINLVSTFLRSIAMFRRVKLYLLEDRITEFYNRIRQIRD